VVVENEYTYGETAQVQPTDVELKPELLPKETPDVRYEGYSVVEEAPVETATDDFEETPLQSIEESLPLPEEAPTEEQAFIHADLMPQYPGGPVAMNRYLFDNLKYPTSASSQNIEGRVWCSFIVGRDGSLGDIQVEKSVYLSLDQEAVRVLRTMPAWSPGIVRGCPARVKVYLPIVFKL
jgi:protein TonB